MKSPLSMAKQLTTAQLIWFGGALVAAIAIYFLFIADSSPKVEARVVRPGTFVQTISVAGKVTPAKEIDLGFTNSGRIVSVNGSVGSRVSQGQVIASIDSSDLRANLAQREAALANQQARLASIKEGVRPEEIAVAQSSVDSAETSVLRARGALIDAIRDAFIRSDDAVRSQVYQFVSNARSTNPQINFGSSNTQALVDVQSAIVATEEMLVAWQLDNNALSDGSDATAAALKAQAHIAMVASLLSRTSTLLSSALPNPTETAADITAYTLDISAARTSISTSNTAISTSLTALKSASSALETAKKNLQLKQAGPVQADIDAQVAQVRSAEADVANVRAQLNKTSIVAPFSGVITALDAKVGLIASPNTAVVTMISSGTFQVESYIPEVNIGLVAVNNAAAVTLDAYGTDVKFPARIASIDPAATVRDGVPSYRAILQFTQADPRIKSGMTANVVITTAEKKDVISVPQGLIIEKADKTYVRVQQGEEILETEVIIGLISSLGEAEVLSGLANGDVLVLSEEK